MKYLWNVNEHIAVLSQNAKRSINTFSHLSNVNKVLFAVFEKIKVIMVKKKAKELNANTKSGLFTFPSIEQIKITFRKT